MSVAQSDRFKAAVALVLEREGAFSDRSDDPGGATWFGIARAFHPEIPWPPTRDQAIEIYHTDCWLRCVCDDLPWPLALMVFDAAVQHAPIDAIMLLQQALGGLRVDGILGPVTLRTARAREPLKVLAEMAALRMVKYAGLANWPTYKLGWSRRLAAMTVEAAQLPDGRSIS